MNKFLELYKLQDKILEIVGRNELDFFLSGGTALHRFHFNNKFRYSEDLDFFAVNPSEIDSFYLFLNGLNNEDVPYKIITNAVNFKQLVVFDSLKIELMYDSSVKEKNFLKTKNNVLLDTIPNILSNKFECIFNRDEPRDCFDIFCILKHTDVNILEAFDTLIQRTNLTSEEVIEKILNYPEQSLQKELLLPKSDSIYENFLKNYKDYFSDVFLDKERRTTSKKKLK